MSPAEANGRAVAWGAARLTLGSAGSGRKRRAKRGRKTWLRLSGRTESCSLPICALQTKPSPTAQASSLPGLTHAACWNVILCLCTGQTPTRSSSVTKAWPCYRPAFRPHPARNQGRSRRQRTANPPICLRTCFLLLEGNYPIFPFIFFLNKKFFLIRKRMYVHFRQFRNTQKMRKKYINVNFPVPSRR